MSATARRISVLVEGDSRSGRAALDEFTKYLAATGKELAKQTQQALDYDKKVLASNKNVAASYDELAGSITRASEQITAAVTSQTADQERLAASAGATSDTVTASMEAQATAIRTTATAFDAAVASQLDSLGMLAEMADTVSRDIIAASERQVLAMRNQSAIVSESATGQEASFGQVGEAATASSADIVKAAGASGAAMRGLVDEMNFYAARATSMFGAADAEILAYQDAMDAQMEERQRAMYSELLADQELYEQQSLAAVKHSQTANLQATAEGNAKIAADQDKLASEVAAADERQVMSHRRMATQSNAAFNLTGTGLSKLGKNTVLTAAGIAGASVYMAAKFESSTTRLLTQAGATTSQVKQMRGSLLDMASQVGQSPEHLSDSFYHVVSAMNVVLPPLHRTAEELKIQKIAAEGAAIGHTQLEETTYALSSAMNALHVNADQAEKTMGTLNAIVGAGDMTMGDLLDAMKSGLIPTARSFGISLESVGSALAVMGDQGMRGALAGTRLRMSIALLAAPSAKAAEMLKAIGLSSGEIHARTTAMSEALEAAGLTTTHMAEDIRKPNGLTVAFRDLDEHLKKSGLSASDTAALLSRAFGGGRMGSTIMLLSQSTDRLDAKFKQIHHTTGTFGKDWSATQQTLTQQAKELEGGIEAVGIKIGTALIPKAKELVGTVKEVVHWFEENEGAAKTLEYTIGTVLATAVGVYAVGSFLKLTHAIGSAATEYKKLQSYFRNGFATQTATAAETTATRGASTATTAEQYSTKIYGAFGATAPGSRANPIVTVVEAGQYGGLGGRAAASEVSAASAAENDAAAAEARSKGNVILPPGSTAAEEAKAAATPVEAAAAVPAEATLAEGAVAGGILTSVKSALGGLLANVMKGGLIAGVGLIASQLLGGAIGGKTGKTVSSIGSGAAIGAGVGTIVLGPGVGTAIGAAIGAAPGVIHALEGPSKGEKEAAALGGGHGHPKLKSAEEEATRIAKWEEKEKLTANRNTTFARRREIERWNREIEQQGNKQKGEAEGKAQKQYVLGGTENPDLGSIIRQSKEDLEKLKPAGREGMLGFIKSMVQTLEKEERLPKGALKHVIDALKPELNNLPHMGAQAGSNFSEQIANGINLDAAKKDLESSTTEIAGRWAAKWKLMAVAPNMSMKEIENTLTSDMAKLEYLMAHGTKRQREEAADQYRKLKPEWEGFVNTATNGVAAELQKGSKPWKALAGKGVAAIVSAYDILPRALQEKLENAGGEVSKGIKKINSQLYKELTQLNGGPIPTISEGGPPLAPGVERVAEAEHKASGGLIQIGKRGEGGHDNIPLNVNGTPIITGRGEKVAIFNRHQERSMDQKLAHEGGLTGFFSRNKKPNYMASGGIIQGPVSTFGPPGEPAGGTAYGSTSAAPGIAVNPHGGGNWNDALARSFAGLVARVSIPGYGHPANLKVIDKGPSAVGAHGPRVIDITGAGAAAMGISANAFPTDATGTADFGGHLIASLAGAVTTARRIAVPHWKGPGGVMGAIGKAVLTKVVASANKQIQAAEAKNLASGSPAGSFEGAVGPAGGPAGLGTFDGLPVAEWIVPELLYAQQHGWHGRITSGWRSPTEVIHSSVVAPQGHSEHQGTQYPHGAVDFGSPSEGANREAFERATAGYTGRRLLKAQGFIDEGHMSGTGHASGGVIEAFAGGGTPKKHPLKATSASTKAQAKAKISHPKSNKPHIGPSAKTDLARKLGKLSYISGLESLPETLAPYEKDLTAEGNLMSLVKTMEGDKLGPVILQKDMQYFAGLSAMGLHPGIPTEEAYRIYERAVAEHGQTPDLELEGDFIKWAEGQATHRLLTTKQAGILTPAGRAVGWTPKAGTPLMQIQEDIEDLEINHLKGEGAKATGVVGWLQNTMDERKKREHHLEHVKTVQKRREAHLKKDLERLTSTSLKNKLHAALDSAYQSERVVDATEHKDAIAEARAGIEATPKKERSRQDEKMLGQYRLEDAKLATYLAHIRNPVASKRASVQHAELAILKNKLKDELKPISDSLKIIDGSEPKISIKGLFSEIKEISSGKETAANEAESILTSKIPSAEENLESIRQAMIESEVPRAQAGAGEPDNKDALLALSQQETQMARHALSAQAAQFEVMTNFEAMMPHYEKGGPVLKDGPIYAHKGEHVVPAQGTLVSSSKAPEVNLHHQTIIQPDMDALFKIIDSRILNPTNARLVSRYQGQRAQNTPGFARSR